MPIPRYTPGLAQRLLNGEPESQPGYPPFVTPLAGNLRALARGYREQGEKMTPRERLDFSQTF